MQAKPLVLSDTPKELRQFTAVVELINCNFNQSKAYQRVFPSASNSTARANSGKFFRDAGVKSEILAQMQRKFDAENVNICEKLIQIIDDSKTRASEKIAGLKVYAQLKGELVVKSENLNKNEPAVKELSIDERAELQAKFERITDDRWRKKESEIGELQRQNQDLNDKNKALTSENARIKELYADAEEQLKIDGFNKIIN